jgi:hypothetical protein
MPWRRRRRRRWAQVEEVVAEAEAEAESRWAARLAAAEEELAASRAEVGELGAEAAALRQGAALLQERGAAAAAAELAEMRLIVAGAAAAACLPACGWAGRVVMCPMCPMCTCPVHVTAEIERKSAAAIAEEVLKARKDAEAGWMELMQMLQTQAEEAQEQVREASLHGPRATGGGRARSLVH